MGSICKGDGKVESTGRETGTWEHRALKLVAGIITAHGRCEEHVPYRIPYFALAS